MPVTHYDMTFKHSRFVLKNVPFIIWHIEHVGLQQELTSNLKPDVTVLRAGLVRLTANLRDETRRIAAETFNEYIFRETECCTEFAGMLIAVSAFLEYPSHSEVYNRASLYV